MKIIIKRFLLLVPLILLVTITSTKAEVVKIDDYEYYQDAVFVKTDSTEFSAAGITADGRLFTWGLNDDGQLGTGDNVTKTTPTEITPSLGLSDTDFVVDVAVGNRHIIVYTNENRFFGMGYNAYGQLGNNSTTSSNLPVEGTINFVLGIGESFIDIAAGENASYALTSAGRYFSWGQGLSGRLGNGGVSSVTTVHDHTSSLVLGLGEVLVDIDVYDLHVLAISDAGNLYGWGFNTAGQLFLGDTLTRTSSTDLMSAFSFGVGETITHFSAGHYFSIVVTSEGNVYTAGTNQEGQIGDGTGINRPDPTDITSGFSFGPTEYPIALDTAYHTLLLTNEGRVFGWGRSSSGCIGPGGNKNIPTDITANFSFEGELPVQVSVSAQNSYVISDANRLYAWGSNASGQTGNGFLGIAYNTDIPNKFPINFDILVQKDFIKNDVSMFETSYNHSLLLLGDGRLFAWGDNDEGAVGIGTTEDQLDPIEITSAFGLGVGETIIDFDTGEGHNVLLTSDNRVFTWGFNFYGQIGIDSQVNQLTPVEITSNIPLDVGDYIVSVYAGRENTFLLSNNGHIFAFGRNLDGCLGDGTTTHQYLPIDVTTNWGLEVGDSPAYILPSWDFTLLVTTQHRVYAVGDNASGELGDGTNINRPNPIEITSHIPFDLSVIGVLDFQVGLSHVGLLNENNDLYMWGSGNQGLTGTGGTSYNTPTLINNQFTLNLGETIDSLSVGASHNLVTTSNGRVFGYGFGIDYALLTGYTVNVLYPQEVTSNVNIGSDTLDYFVMGLYTTFIVTQENNLFAVGRNSDGQLGVGDTMLRQTLNKVTKDAHDLATIKFIYMQEEQYVLNSHLYIELYFEHKIGDYLTGVTINGTTYGLSDIEEDVGKITVRIANTYTLGETPSFTVQNVWFDTDNPVPNGPVDVECVIANDVLDPSFDPIDDQVIQVGSADMDWTTLITNLEDNSPGVITLSETDGVDYNTMGTYPVSVTATDESGNSHTELFVVEVTDLVPPVIEYTGLTTLEVGGNYDFMAYVTATDNLDGDLTASIWAVTSLDQAIVGTYNIQFGVSDSNGNEATLNVSVDVVDTTAPTFDLPTNTTIELGTPDINWTSYMTNVQDNSGMFITYEWIDNVNYFVEGIYNAEVIAEDPYGNLTQKTITVTVEDTIAPDCDPILDITYEINTENNVDYSQYVTNIVEASYEPVEFDWVDTVNYGQVGSYPMSITLTDGALNSNTIYFTVHIVDTTAPIMAYYGPDTFEAGSPEYDYTMDLMLSDNSGGPVIITDIISTVDMNRVDVYLVTIYAEDESGNSNSLELIIFIQDTTAPTFDYIPEQLFLIDSPSPVDWSLLVTNVVENSSGGYGIAYDDYVNYFVPGYYTVEIYVYDSFGNASHQSITVLVADGTPPVLTIYDNIDVSLGESPDYYSYFDAVDAIDGDVEYLSVFDEGSLDIMAVGTYTVTIYAYDESGNVSWDTIEVNVLDTTPPTFDPIDTQVFELGEYDTYDWLTLVENLTDNWDQNPTVVVIHEDIDWTTPGVYQVGIRVQDSSMNYVDSFFDVFVEDTIPPEFIEQLDNREISVTVIEITIEDQAGNVTDASGQVTFDFECPVEFGVVGNYICTVTALDPSGNTSEMLFVVSVIDDVPPVVTLIGDEIIYVELGETYVDPGSTCEEIGCILVLDASDTEDPDQDCGDSIIEYIWSDEAGNLTRVTRTVIVQDTTPPVVELLPGIDTIFQNEMHYDAGIMVTELDDYTINITSDLDITTPGAYTINYLVLDESLNQTNITRHVYVLEPEPVVIFEIGPFNSTLYEGDELVLPTCAALVNGTPVPCVINPVTASVGQDTLTFSAEASYQGTTHTIEVYYWDFDVEVPSPDGYYRKKEWEVEL